jgi:hypothetical protein
MRWFGCVLATSLFSATAVCQVAFSPCDVVNHPFARCEFVPRTDNEGPGNRGGGSVGASFSAKSANAFDRALEDGNAFVSTRERREKRGFHWGRALFESFTLLSIEQAYVVKDDWRWVGGSSSENGIPFNHYWRDYKQSLSSWIHAGWNDGDPLVYGYVGHPIQGVAASYIFIQNDPKSERVEFSKTKEYWQSRLKATLWNAAYSTQWNIGPLSEATVEKYGTHWRPPWNQNGTWPCTTKNCYTGMGQIDLVITPLGGFVWLVGEDMLDRFVTRRVEGATRNRFLIDATRCGLDPIRMGTNILHGKRPWYRGSRDARETYLAAHPPNLPAAVSHDSDAGASH